MDNVKQVGGDHYLAEYQHWDWVVDIKMGYLEGCATKYVSRWWKKGGVQDLEKALTYVEKLLEKYGKVINLGGQMSYDIREQFTITFITANKLPTHEADFCRSMANWSTRHDLYMARSQLSGLMLEAAKRAAGGPLPAPWPTLPATPATMAPAPAPAPVDVSQVALLGAEVADASFGPCPCGCGRTRAKNMNYATPECQARGLTGIEQPFGYTEDDGA